MTARKAGWTFFFHFQEMIGSKTISWANLASSTKSKYLNYLVWVLLIYDAKIFAMTFCFKPSLFSTFQMLISFGHQNNSFLYWATNHLNFQKRMVWNNPRRLCVLSYEC